MPLSAVSLGGFRDGSSGASWALTGISAARGDLLVVCVAADNAGASGIASLAGVTDSGGNTYTQRAITNRTGGSASDGATLGIWTAPVTAALLEGTITVAFSPNTTRKAAVVWRVTPGAFDEVAVRSVGAGATGSSSTPSITATSVASGDTIIGACAAESRDETTADADSSNGSWSSQDGDATDSGSDATSMAIGSQYKTTIAAGDQTYNPTLAGTRDWAINYLVLYAASRALSTTELTGALTQAVELELSGPDNGWTDVAGEGDVSDAIAQCRYGFDGDQIDARIAPPGDWTFGLDNSAQNSQGQAGAYSRFNPSRRSGFDYNIGARWHFTYLGRDYYKFRGRLADIDAGVGIVGSPLTRCKVLDWLDDAMRTPRPAIGAQLSQRADQVVATMLDELDVEPPARSLEASASTLTAALDSGGRNLFLREELQRLALSEVSYGYMRGDGLQGGTFMFEARGHRSVSPITAITFTDTAIPRDGLVLVGTREQIYRAVQATVYPVRQETGVELYTLESPIPLNAGQVITFTVPYRHPDRNEACGGTSVDPFDDYAMWENDDATGDDLTSDLDGDAVDLGWGVQYTLTNTGSDPGYVTTLVAMGTAIVRQAITVEKTVADPTGDQVLELKLPYQSSVALADVLVTQLATLLSTPVARVQTITFCAHVSDALMVAALGLEIGDRVAITEPVSGLSEALFTIHGVQLEMRKGGVLWCTWNLIPWGLDAWWAPSNFAATGGTVTETGGFTLHTFTSDGTFEITGGETTVEYLVVAGGAAGGDALSASGGGGGGGGGEVQAGSTMLGVGTYAVTVGAGGTVVSNGRGNNGGTSSIAGVASATGGGGGGVASSPNGKDGGPGGGGGVNGVGGDEGGGDGTSGLTSPNWAAGGGAGAGGAGGNASSGRGGNGGPGVENAITGSSETYGGGGGGWGATGGSGGTGGGGAPENQGTDGKGGGGGRSARGGNGIVILRYPTPF